MEEKKLYELTNPQKSIWYTEQYYKGTAINNICGSVFIKEKVNFDILKKAINSFIENNDSFKLRFKLVDGVPHQYFIDNMTYEFDEINVKDIDEVNSYAEKLAGIPFEIIESQLFSFTLFKLPDGRGGFIINAHHIISDAATFAILVQEIINNYSLLLNNQEIPTKSYSYKDYIKSEKDYLSSSRYEKDKNYWNEQYKEIPETATIPSFKSETDKPNSLREEFELDKKLLNKINAFCTTNHISLYNFLIAIYSIYIGRVNNTDIFSIGSPILNRANFAEKHTSGMFISTSLLKINTDGNPTFSEFAERISTLSMSMLRHQKYNYQCILDDLRKNQPDVSNLYDIVLSYQITKANDTSLDVPYDIKWYNTPFIGNSLNIHFHDNNDSGNLLVEYDYKSSKYDKEDIFNMHKRICHIFDQVLDNSDILLNDIEIVTPEEKDKILNVFNDTKMDYPKDKTIVDLFEEQVEKHPDSVAVVFENQKLTYKELNERANQLAWYLKDNGVKKGDIIGIHLEKNIEYISSILAVLKLGCVFIPISTSYPKDRIEYMLHNSNANFLISISSLIKNLNIYCPFIDITNFEYNNSNKNVNESLSTEDLIYILYTSGSTGQPKGVMINNMSLVNHIFAINQRFNNSINCDDVALSIANISFDANIQELFIPLMLGSSLHLLKNDSIYDINYLSEYIAKNKITFAFIPPSILEDIYELIKNKRSIYLNKLLVGVESISNLTLNKYLRLLPNIQIHNGYGPTEATICCISYMYRKNNSNLYVPIGTPMSNTKIFILNPQSKKLQPIGYPGEIYISGDCLSKGYINNSLQTKNNFINIPYISDTCYKTGDYGYYLSDGNIMFVGRKDFQVKLRGHRIELNEINILLKSFNNIKKSATIVYDNRHIVSYITSDSKINIENLKKYLNDKLPNYMIPNHIIQLTDLPYTTNGKIDLKKLQSYNFRFTTSDNIVLPTNSIQAKLVDILANLLSTNKISTKSNIFDIGADSLIIIKLSSYIKNELGADISVAEIFEHPTIIEISELVDIKKKNLSKIDKVKIFDYYPLSSAQKRIYYSSNMDNTGTSYNMPGGLILSKVPDINKLERCFNTIIERHETLRTYFDVINGEVVQKIKNKINFKIETSDNICVNKHSAFMEFVRPFDLSKAPLIRIKLLKLEKEKALLLFDMHHIISDGASMQILINELCNLYNGNSLQPLDITYKDYAVWEQESLLKNKFKESEKYWLEQFKGDIPVLNMPTNYKKSNFKSYVGSNVYKKIDIELTNSINNLSKSLGITPYMLMLSCYYILLYKYTSNTDIIIGTPIVGRENTEINNVIGMFVNSLALRAKINQNQSIAELIQTVKNICLKAFKHQVYPFDELINKLKIKREAGTNPLFDTMFIYQSEGNPNVSLGNIKSKYYIPDNRTSKFDLSIEVTPNGKHLDLRLEYSTKLFNKKFIDNLSIHYINILKKVIEDINTKIENIDMVTDEEKNKILYEFNNTKTDYPKNKTIAELFEEQVNKNPNKKAVFFEGKSLTYKQLNEKANQLANYIINQKTKKEDIVCLLFDKSLEMIISILAVIKAGCAFLPIDVYYPKDRIDFMIRDSKSKLLLTTNEFVNKSNDTIKTICIDLEDKNIYNDKYSNNIDTTNVSSDNLAYVMYTSGSTGNPKGVMIEQKNIIRLVKNTNYIKFRKNDRILQTGSIVFDACTFEIWGALLNGCQLYLIKKDDLLDTSNFKDYLIKNKITILWLTAPLFNQLVEADHNILDTVKYILTGGDVLSPKHINIVKNSNPKINIINGYGPTENTTFSCCFNIDKQYKDSIPIGYPIANSTCYIVSITGMIQPIGCPGELWVGGDGVARGYLNNEILSNEKFIKNPFGEGRIYKTGDLTKWLPNGQIEFLGRIDSQVKIRGFRIEPEEINAKISIFPNIKECTTVINIINDEKTICSYFVSDENIDNTDLKNYLKQCLPSYMIPTYYMQLKKLPLNTNGKIDKKLLPTDFKLKHSAYKITTPKNEKEEILLNIFKKILNNEDIGTTDNFFDIGGDSLLAMKLKVEALSSDLIINYADIFQYPTVKELAKSINHSNSQQDFKELDFSKYDKILEKNCISNLKDIKYNKLNNILLTGFTGFLGAHVLDSFIKQENGVVYCLIRGKNNMTAQERLINVLHFYFNKKYDKYIGNRIQLIEGDITFDKLGLSNEDYEKLGKNINTVIHCAALVKHFGTYDEFKNINIYGTQKIIDLCTKYKLKLLHVSTISVSGNAFAEDSYVENNFTEDIDYNETNFYIGQNLQNLYIKSKFEAERLVFEAINNGLEACILRMGNLTSRATEGKFQQNHFENAFVNRFKSILQIKYAPDYLLTGYVEFTPIDYCGDAIIKLASHFNKNYTVFHLLNDNHVDMIRLFETLKDLNIDLTVVSSEEFISIIDSLLHDDNKKTYLEGIINDFNSDKELVYESPVKIKSDFTKEYLKRIGFEWPYIDKKYIKNYLKYLADIGYFNIEIN